MKQMHELNKQCYITFYGDWIGRPCDNVYLVKTIEEKADRIRIVLDVYEVMADNPRNIQSDTKSYTIAHADKVTVYENGLVYRIYEKTNEGLTRTEDGHTDVIKVESPYFAVNVSMLNWNG